MKKLTFHFWMDDTLYLERLMAYVKQSPFALQCNIQCWCGKEKGAELLAMSLDAADWIICEDGYMSQEILQYASSRLIVLELGLGLNIETHTVPKVKLYQPLPQLLRQLIEIADQTCPAVPEPSNDGLAGSSGNGGWIQPSKRVLSVYSMDGGSGKTTTAYVLANMLLHQKKQKVFYLNFETFPTTPCLTEKQLMNVSELLYFLKTDSGQTGLLPAAGTVGTDQMLPSFQPAYHLRDLDELSLEDTQKLIDFILYKAGYDLVIIDLDPYLHQRTVGALQRSDGIWWLVSSDWRSQHRVDHYLDQCGELCGEDAVRWQQKLFFILNKYTGSQDELNRSSIANEFHGFLPYVPEWKAITEAGHLLQHQLYMSQIEQLWERWVCRYGGELAPGSVGASASR